MPTLKHCIDEIFGATLPKAEVGILKAAVQDYRDEGYTGKDANVAAIRDFLDGLQKQRNAIIGEINRQTGRASSSAKPATDKAKTQATGTGTIEIIAPDGKRTTRVMIPGEKYDVSIKPPGQNRATNMRGLTYQEQKGAAHWFRGPKGNLEVLSGEYITTVRLSDTSAQKKGPGDLSVKEGGAGSLPRKPSDVARELRAAFPTARIDVTLPTQLTVHLPNGSNIKIDTESGIVFNQAAAEKAYGRPLKPGEKPVAAWSRVGRDGIMWITKEADQSDVHHEAFHAAMDLALTEKQRKAVLDQYGSEENAAMAYAKWSPAKSENALFQAILDFFTKLRQAVSPTAEGAFAQIRRGDVWNKSSEAQRTAWRKDPASTPIGAGLDARLEYALDAEKWQNFQDSHEFGVVNNRLAKELEVVERLLGPVDAAIDLPGKFGEKGVRETTRSIRARDLGEALYQAKDDGTLTRLLDRGVTPETLADERGLEGKARKAFVDEVASLRSGPLLIENDASGNPILSGNGKAAASVDLALGTCQPTAPCRECYAAASMIRMSSVRKALRNTIQMIENPEAFGRRVAEEARKIPKDRLPFIRLLGSGDLTSDETVQAFNAVAKHADRPIQIFSRHHDNLGKLKGTQEAPFIKMGSLDQDLYKHYGLDFLAGNMRERGINNAWLYTDRSELEAIQSLRDKNALGLVLSASHKLHESLPVDIQMRSCPCDAGERTYLGSCRQCALGTGGCFVGFVNKAVDTNGKVWDLDDEGLPKKVKPVLSFLRDFKPSASSKIPAQARAYGRVAADIMKKSIELINLYRRQLETGEKNAITLKDLRWSEDAVRLLDKEHYGTQDVKDDRTFLMSRDEIHQTIEDYIQVLRGNIKEAEKGTLYLPGGEIQKPVAFKKGKRMASPETISKEDAQNLRFSLRQINETAPVDNQGDVTEAMVDSVMQGQPLFSKTAEGQGAKTDQHH
ncbi:MAG: gluconate 2-dehydrogenase subunit 3 family protein, partial [Syntrophales bacterium]|nr:gluconate 2-dehydrogenase subunit 3 family protein [Syntrophales bacterium]